MDDIVTVLAEEHGCLDTIKVESKSLVALFFHSERVCLKVFILGRNFGKIIRKGL